MHANIKMESLRSCLCDAHSYHCAVMHLKGMALNHLVISQLQHLLENSSIADVREASKTVHLLLHQWDQSSSYKVLAV